jgi:hypothetical protein
MATEAHYLTYSVSGAWNNPTNATAVDDGSCADTVTDAAQHIWKATRWTLPANATVTGIEVKAHCAGDSDDDVDVEINENGGVLWSDIRTIADQAGSNCAGAADTTLGSSDYLWGNTWATAAINGNGIFARFTYNKSGKANSWFLDAAEITVHYSTVTASTAVLTGGLSFDSGILSAKPLKKLIGGLTFLGGLVSKPLKKVTGGLTFVGDLVTVLKAKESLAGGLTFLGGLATQFIATESLAGELTFTGTLATAVTRGAGVGGFPSEVGYHRMFHEMHIPAIRRRES